MNKKNLISFIKNKLAADLEFAIAAAKSTLDAATNEESKPENEYDTRGLEASYLAGAQAKRVAEIEEVIYLFEHGSFNTSNLTEKIAVGSLVGLEGSEGKKTFVLLMPKGGGQLIKFEGQSIQLITVQSPLGEAIVGLKTGDSAEVETGSTYQEYEIISIE
jgi:transcription elongation GreA/GreB family factor